MPCPLNLCDHDAEKHVVLYDDLFEESVTLCLGDGLECECVTP